MFASYGDVLEEHTYVELADNPQYATYLAAMDNSINRAVLYMQSSDVLPKCEATLSAPCVSGSVATFNLATIPDLERVVALYCATPKQYATCSYIWEGGTTLVVPLYQAGEYVLVYEKKWREVDALSADDTDLPIPDALCCLIPYFVKSELYEEEDMQAAKNAKAVFEEGVANYRQKSNTSQSLRAVYQWSEL